ncbi:hypothetical protein [Streptomyces sp. NPDC058045]|uniref:hypothetical protein n=1 Tax=Streptomyces sp. NPDC058045 TaxID=3346311 RepID=UPI0036E5A0FA
MRLLGLPVLLRYRDSLAGQPGGEPVPPFHRGSARPTAYSGSTPRSPRSAGPRDGAGPAAHTADSVLHTGHAVLAVPPALALARIDFDGQLPAEPARLARLTPVWTGAVAKVLARYQDLSADKVIRRPHEEFSAIGWHLGQQAHVAHRVPGWGWVRRD